MLSRGPLQLLYTSTIFGKLSLAGSLWCTCCCSRLQLIYSKGEASRIFNQTSPLCYSTILSGELTICKDLPGACHQPWVKLKEATRPDVLCSYGGAELQIERLGLFFSLVGFKRAAGSSEELALENSDPLPPVPTSRHFCKAMKSDVLFPGHNEVRSSAGITVMRLACQECTGGTGGQRIARPRKIMYASVRTPGMLHRSSTADGGRQKQNAS